MTKYKYPPLASVHTTAVQDNAFDSDSVDADKLIVGAGAFLVAEGAQAFAAFLGVQGAWTVSVIGSILSTQNVGIHLALGNPDASSISVGLEGEVYGGGSAGGVDLFSQATLNNAGIIAGAIYGIATGGNTTCIIINSGTISGGQDAIVDLTGDTADKVTNSGTISGNVALSSGSGSAVDQLTNSGKIFGEVFLTNGNLKNSGTITGGVTGGEGANTFVNFIVAGDGSIRSGRVDGLFDLLGGNDLFKGGSNAEIVRDRLGQDTYLLGGGNDELRAFYITSPASDQDDTVNGGRGIDTYDASSAISGSTPGDPGAAINLDSIGHTFVYRGATITISAHRGNNIVPASPSGFDSAGDSIFQVERVYGTSFDDVLFGSSGGNTLKGNDGADRLFGLGGQDQFAGGAGSDSFVFLKLSDSGSSALTRDTIVDFSQIEADKLDLSALHVLGSPGTLNFVGTNVDFTGAAGQIRAYWTGSGQIVEVDADGDAASDFSIKIVDVNHVLALTGADFIL